MKIKKKKNKPVRADEKRLAQKELNKVVGGTTKKKKKVAKAKSR